MKIVGSGPLQRHLRIQEMDDGDKPVLVTVSYNSQAFLGCGIGSLDGSAASAVRTQAIKKQSVAGKKTPACHRRCLMKTPGS